MKEHYDGDTPVVTLNCKICGEEFENYGLTIAELEDLSVSYPDTLNCGACDP